MTTVTHSSPDTQAPPADTLDSDNFRTMVAAANDALDRIARTIITQWLDTVAPVVMAGRAEAMETAGGKASGPKYSKAWSAWATKVGFNKHKIDAPTRNALAMLDQHRNRFNEWWNEQTDHHQQQWHHPRVVWRKFRSIVEPDNDCTGAIIVGEPALESIDSKPIEEMTPAELQKVPRAALLKRVATIIKARDRYKADLEELSNERSDLASWLDLGGEQLEVDNALRSQPASLADPHRVVRMLKAIVRDWERDLAAREGKPKPVKSKRTGTGSKAAEETP